MAEDLPEPDRTPGAPHPRETARLFGHEDAEAAFLSAFAAGRLHHAWMLGGPRGIGKATLAWRIARFLLSQPGPGEDALLPSAPPDSLDTPADSPLARRMRALAEPRLFLLRRGASERGGQLAQFIGIDEVRRMKSFFALSAADGGARVALVDSLDEMNPASANALLKLIEEPPAAVTFLMIAHQPARLLPTIRSRCRMLTLAPLAPAPLASALEGAGAAVAPEDREALAELAGGSVGWALRLARLDGLETYRELVAILAGAPRLDRMRALTLAESAAKGGAEDRFDLILTQIEQFLSRLARAAATRITPPEAAPGEAALFARLAPGPACARPWAELAQELSLRARRGRAVNLDPAALLMDTLLRIDATAGKLAT